MPTPPDSLPDDASALKALLVAAHAENERLIAIIKELQRHRFGPRSEKIDPDQLALMLEPDECSAFALRLRAIDRRRRGGCARQARGTAGQDAHPAQAACQPRRLAQALA